MSLPSKNTDTLLIDSSAHSREAASRNDLGDNIQQLRKSRGWSLEKASAAIEMSRSALIKIEKGQMSPTFDAILKIAAGFNVSVTQLLSPMDKDVKRTARYEITRKKMGEYDTHPAEVQEFLAPSILGKKILPYKGVIKARSFDEMKEWIAHNGEEFMIVLSGQVVFCTECYAPTVLNPGDSVYFDSGMGHFTYSLGEEDAEVLWVMSNS